MLASVPWAVELTQSVPERLNFSLVGVRLSFQ